MSDPVFSVVMPLYNKARYVSHAIDSVLAQTGHEFEVVVIDDGSTDGGAEVVRTRNDPRVQLLQQPNSGVSAARNAGIRAARGKYIAFLDADDYYLPGFFDAIGDLIHRFPEAGTFATNFRRVWENGQVEANGGQDFNSSGPIGLVGDFYRYWADGPMFFTSCVVVRRGIFFEHDIFFPVGERLGEDQDVWFRLAEQYPVAYCRRELSAYRVGNLDSLSGGPVPTELLPCIQRLRQRLEAGMIPRSLERGARRLFATHLIATARARIAEGKRAAAIECLLDRHAWRRPLAVARTWARVLSMP